MESETVHMPRWVSPRANQRRSVTNISGVSSHPSNPLTSDTQHIKYGDWSFINYFKVISASQIQLAADAVHSDDVGRFPSHIRAGCSNNPIGILSRTLMLLGIAPTRIKYFLKLRYRYISYRYIYSLLCTATVSTGINYIYIYLDINYIYVDMCTIEM